MESIGRTAVALSVGAGRSLVFARWGRVGGRRLLWISGNPGSRLSRHPDPDFVARHDLDVVTFDRPGYGRSTRRAGRSVVDTAADVEPLLDALGWDRCEILGLSGGGAHALACGAVLPQRVSAIGVAGCPNPPGRADWSDGAIEVNRRDLELVRSDREMLDRELAEAAARIVEQPRAAIEAMSADADAVDRALLRRPEVGDMLVDSLVEAFAVDHHGWFDDTVAVNTAWGFELEAVGVPVLVVVGALDRQSPATQARRIASELPDAALVTWSGVGHLSALDRLDEVLDLLASRSAARRAR